MDSAASPTHAWSSLTHAIVVCGHAIYHGGPRLSPPCDAELDRHWLLQPFQKGEGKHYISHVRAGVELASQHAGSLLIFSGGQTRFPSILSEAQGYHDVATVFNFWGQHDVRGRVTTEEFSRDSFDNVLFGIARFHECVGVFPRSLTLVSWSFKQERFTIHATAIRWPLSSFRFLGVGLPDELEKARAAEAATLSKFQKDPFGYGYHDTMLGKKKNARNPYRRQNGYAQSCPSMAPLLQWRGPHTVPESHVPWAATNLDKQLSS